MLLDDNKNDVVNHPKHYKECSIECIDVMRLTFGEEAVYNYCMCNAFKYLWRHEHKNGREDLEKGIWYVEYVFENFEKFIIGYDISGESDRVKLLKNMLYDKLSKTDL